MSAGDSILDAVHWGLARQADEHATALASGDTGTATRIASAIENQLDRLRIIATDEDQDAVNTTALDRHASEHLAIQNALPNPTTWSNP